MQFQRLTKVVDSFGATNGSADDGAKDGGVAAKEEEVASGEMFERTLIHNELDHVALSPLGGVIHKPLLDVHLPVHLFQATVPSIFVVKNYIIFIFTSVMFESCFL